MFCFTYVVLIFAVLLIGDRCNNLVVADYVDEENQNWHELEDVQPIEGFMEDFSGPGHQTDDENGEEAAEFERLNEAMSDDTRESEQQPGNENLLDDDESELTDNLSNMEEWEKQNVEEEAHVHEANEESRIDEPETTDESGWSKLQVEEQVTDGEEADEAVLGKPEQEEEEEEEVSEGQREQMDKMINETPEEQQQDRGEAAENTDFDVQMSEEVESDEEESQKIFEETHDGSSEEENVKERVDEEWGERTMEEIAEENIQDEIQEVTNAGDESSGTASVLEEEEELETEGMVHPQEEGNEEEEDMEIEPATMNESKEEGMPFKRADQNEAEAADAQTEPAMNENESMLEQEGASDEEGMMHEVTEESTQQEEIPHEVSEPVSNTEAESNKFGAMSDEEEFVVDQDVNGEGNEVEVGTEGDTEESMLDGVKADVGVDSGENGSISKEDLVVEEDYEEKGEVNDENVLGAVLLWNFSEEEDPSCDKLEKRASTPWSQGILTGCQLLGVEESVARFSLSVNKQAMSTDQANLPNQYTYWIVNRMLNHRAGGCETLVGPAISPSSSKDIQLVGLGQAALCSRVTKGKLIPGIRGTCEVEMFEKRLHDLEVGTFEINLEEAVTFSQLFSSLMERNQGAANCRFNGYLQ